MLTKQLRELERQATVVNTANMLTLKDLMEYNEKYYVGDLVDLDGSNWVDRNMAQQILDQLNIDWVSQAGRDITRIFTLHN